MWSFIERFEPGIYKNLIKRSILMTMMLLIFLNILEYILEYYYNFVDLFILQNHFIDWYFFNFQNFQMILYYILCLHTYTFDSPYFFFSYCTSIHLLQFWYSTGTILFLNFVCACLNWNAFSSSLRKMFFFFSFFGLTVDTKLQWIYTETNKKCIS